MSDESEARRLRERRVESGLTQAQLAARAGVSRALVSAIEAGRNLPRIDAALALARALDTTAEQLFGGRGSEPVDAISGEPPEPGAPVRVGLVGNRLVTSVPRHGDEGWDAVDGIAGELGPDLLQRGGASVVMAGCEPGLTLLERMLRDRGTRAVSIASSNATALAALSAGRLHAAAVHFAAGESPSFESAPLLRVHLGRWQVGLAAPHGARRRWWESALGGRVAVIQREPGAAAQEAFLRAVRARKGDIDGPRVGGHLAASRRALESGLPAVTIEPAAAAVGAAFHPLELHDVELWLPAERAADPGVARLLDALSSAAFRQTLQCVGGYDLSDIGRRVA
ncbi:MAG: helix-turn-helix domain-containing protein [Deltaproteobacteria bacterium]|nr:helix-turn-helix domain-containing protein [Deltaproteobacteria bacterium]